jgi:hypothetical protein
MQSHSSKATLTPACPMRMPPVRSLASADNAAPGEPSVLSHALWREFRFAYSDKVLYHGSLVSPTFLRGI